MVDRLQAAKQRARVVTPSASDSDEKHHIESDETVRPKQVAQTGSGSASTKLLDSKRKRGEKQ